jgi:hypothetical protein
MTDHPTAPQPPTSAARTDDTTADDSGDPELEAPVEGESLELGAEEDE